METPSQMLEHWSFNRKTIRILSRHYKDNSSIPKSMLHKLFAPHDMVGAGLALEQVFHAMFDILIHTEESINTWKMTKDLYKDLLGIERIEGTNAAATLFFLGNR